MRIQAAGGSTEKGHWLSWAAHLLVSGVFPMTLLECCRGAAAVQTMQPESGRAWHSEAWECPHRRPHPSAKAPTSPRSKPVSDHLVSLSRCSERGEGQGQDWGWGQRSGPDLRLGPGVQGSLGSVQDCRTAGLSLKLTNHDPAGAILLPQPKHHLLRAKDAERGGSEHQRVRRQTEGGGSYSTFYPSSKPSIIRIAVPVCPITFTDDHKREGNDRNYN